MTRALFLPIIALLVLSSAYAATETYSVAIENSAAGVTRLDGMEWKALTSTTLTGITKVAISGATHCHLRTTVGGSDVASGTYSGNTCTFSSSYAVTSGTTYYLLNDANGGSWTTTYGTAGAPTYPVTGSASVGQFTKSCSAGACNTFNYREIVGITYAAAGSTYGLVNISAKQLFSNLSISTFNATSSVASNTTSTGQLLLVSNNGTQTIQINVSGNLTTNITCNVVFNATTSCNATGIYDTVLNVSFRNAYTNASVNTFSGWLYHPGSGTNISFATSTGNVTMPALREILTVFVDAAGYSMTSDNNSTFTPNSASYNKAFLIYSNNSALINIYNASSGASITQSVTVQLIGTNRTYSNTTTTGTLLMENVQDGSYTVKVISSGFTTGTYTITVADRSTQTLNAYLSPTGGSTVVFSISDLESGNLLSGASIAMYTSVNGTTQLVESRSTDITGRAQFTYNAGQQYSFLVTATGYQNNEFSLDPVIFTSYDVKMRRTTSSIPQTDYATVSVDYTPKRFYANSTNNLTVTFYSGNGTLQSYNTTITYPGGSSNSAGNISTGEQFSISMDLTSATPSDYVNVSYCYDTVYGDPHCFGPFSHRIIGAYYPNTLAGLKDKTYGLGLFERILIVVCVAVVVAGIVAMVGGALAGGLAAMLVMFFFVSTGFVPLWAVLVSLVAGTFLIMKGGFA